jgi:O-antigen/teichoic acid export membrane protein
MAVGAVVAAWLAGPVITSLYGTPFTPAIPAFVWLMPGIALLSVYTILMNYFAAAGMPWVVVIAPAIGLAVNVLLNLRLIQALGIVGASISSSIAYGIMLVVAATYYLRSRSAVS